MTEVTLKKTDGAPTIEVFIGQAHFGTYRIKNWDKDGRNPKLVGEGFNDDEISDEFSLGPVNQLNSRKISWKARTASLDPRPGDRYHIKVEIRQKGRAVPGGTFVYSDTLDGVKTIGDFTTLKVV